MNSLILFLIKASFSLSLFYLVFWIFLKRETLFLTNRFFLISSLCLSIILPLIPIYYNANISNDLSLKEMAGTFLETGRLNGIDGSGVSAGLRIALIIYLCGVVIFFFRIVIQFISLLGLIFRNGVTISGNTRIVYNKRYTIPFSFLNMVFINPENIRESEFSDIIAHEKVHIREYHWFDLLMVELISIIFWFNPFIWFYERSIKQNHEYLADEGVIAQGFNAGRYHSVLINQLMGMELIGITNNLNYSLNAKRLKMMKRKKSSKRRALRILWSLPVLFILVAAFANPRYENREISDETINPLNSTAIVKITAAVLDKNGDPIPGANIKVKGSKEGTTSNSEGLFSMAVNDSDILIISVNGFEDSVIEMKKLVEKQGKSEEYKVKILMVAKGDTQAKATESKASKTLSKEELEDMLKKLTLKKEELGKMKEKISQAEKEGSIDPKELDKKKQTLKAEMIAVSEKMDVVSKQLQSFKK